MSGEEPSVVQRIVNAWDCCGTCAGGVLAAHDAATADRVRRETLREAAHWFGVIWGTGLTTEAQVADVLNRWAEHGIGSRGDE